MDELRAAHVAKGGDDLVENGVSMEIVKKNGLHHEEDFINRKWVGDKRLSLYSYTLETINMLLLPMIQTKYVHKKSMDFNQCHQSAFFL